MSWLTSVDDVPKLEVGHTDPDHNSLSTSSSESSSKSTSSPLPDHRGLAQGGLLVRGRWGGH